MGYSTIGVVYRSLRNNREGAGSHPGHAKDFAWYRGQRPSPGRVIKMSHNKDSRTRKWRLSPARVIKMSHNKDSRTRKCGGFVA